MIPLNKVFIKSLFADLIHISVKDIHGFSLFANRNISKRRTQKVGHLKIDYIVCKVDRNAIANFRTHLFLTL